MVFNLTAQTTTINLLPGENWWGGRTKDAPLMPFQPGYEADLRWNNGNQVQPLLLSDQGRFVWCETTFAFVVTDSTLVITTKGAKIQQGKFGQNLREAYQFAAENLFPFKGKMPDSLFFTAPQYTSWKVADSKQKQSDVVDYAQQLIDNGYPPGVFILDGEWQGNDGGWDFDPNRFQQPKRMIDVLHELGFKVMLTISPFIKGDSPVFQELYTVHDAFLHDPNLPGKALLLKWQNEENGLLDFTHPPAKRWLLGELERLQGDYGIDGFKFAGGDFDFYHWAVPHQKSTGFAEQNELYAQLGRGYSFNSHRASFKLGGEPLVQEVSAAPLNWANLQALIPNVTLLGLMGYPFACPGGIGGSDSSSSSALSATDQEQVVRSAQASALMPMLRLSGPPWHALDTAATVAVKKAIALHVEFGPLFLKLAKEAAITGEPIVQSMAYAFAPRDYALVNDQFMLGSDYLVAPVLELGVRQREVILPAGKWAYVPSGEVFTGPAKVTVEVPLEVLAYFKRM